MKLPEWTGPALWGAVAGGLALAFVGFNWGGWVKGGTALKMSQASSSAAVAEALTPYCLAASQADPLVNDVMLEHVHFNWFHIQQRQRSCSIRAV